MTLELYPWRWWVVTPRYIMGRPEAPCRFTWCELMSLPEAARYYAPGRN
jgi:hypothetical protein